MMPESKQDLMAAYKLDPDNKAVRKELQLLKVIRQMIRCWGKRLSSTSKYAATSFGCYFFSPPPVSSRLPRRLR